MATVTLHRTKTLFARLQGGHLQAGDILDGDKVIGSWSWRSERKKGVTTERTTYVLADGRQFATAREFRIAYEQQTKESDNGRTI